MIEVRDVSYTYSEGSVSRTEALSHISLTVNDGDFIGLIGHTGSGKSTLTQILAGIMRPLSGRLFYDGRDMTDIKNIVRASNGKVGLVFQYPEHQLFEETIYKDIAFGPRNLGCDENTVKERVREAAELVGLEEDILETSPFELSGGQKRRAAIAGVLAMHPDVLILDEPTAGLDPRGREGILYGIGRVHQTWCKSVVLVSHSMEDVAKNANRVVVLDRGVLKMDGSVREVFSRADALAQMGLAAPQISRVAAALKKKGIDLQKDIFTVEDAADAVLSKIGGGGIC
ncbi:MAG: energy-coupling factor transporter ATPase [Clostridia bacterium]|nr:energy-coupling factor transporter ATPase [Clostridia bacterium]